MKSRHFFLVMLALCALSCIGLKARAADKKQKEYTFLAPVYNIGSGAGFSMAGYAENFKQMSAIVSKEFGLNIKPVFVGDSDMNYDGIAELMAKELAKRGDFALISYDSYKMAKKMKAPIRPMVLVSMFGEKTNKYCLFAKKSSGYKSLEDLKGKRFASPEPANKLEFLGIFNKSNADTWKSFKLVRTGDFQSQLYAVIMDEADFSYGPSYIVKLLAMLDARFKKLEPVVCGDVCRLNILVVGRKSVPDDVFKKVTELLSNYRKFKEFRQIPYYNLMKMADIKLEPVTEKDLAELEKGTQAEKQTKKGK